MSYSEIVTQTALNLARANADLAEAIAELRVVSADRRVAVVVSHQQLMAEAEGGDEMARRAATYLDALLAQWPPM
jgi:hypothetical protein